MGSIHTQALSLNNAQLFMKSVALADANTIFYVTLGREEPWSNENSPDVPQTTVNQEFDVWNNMYGGKQVVLSDMSLVIPRIDWTANTVYTPYDQAANNLYDTANTKFYVLTTDFNVYKCLFNNGSANSTVMPNSTSNNNVQITTDGYMWKFMYQLSSNDQQRFLTNNWIPVRTLGLDDGSLQWNVQQNAIDGGLNVIKVLNGGTGFTNVANISAIITGDGAGATILVQVNTSNSIANSTISTPGALYTRANVSLTDRSGVPGSGASFEVVVPPKGGHGANPSKELGAAAVMIDMLIDGSEANVISVANEYRQIAIIRDPFISSTNTVSANLVFSQTMDLTLAGSGVNYSLDEVVFQGSSLAGATFSADVLEWKPADNILRVTNISGVPDSSLLLGINSGAAYFVTNVKQPDLEPYTGDLLYLANIVAVQRNENQTDAFQIVVNF